MLFGTIAQLYVAKGHTLLPGSSVMAKLSGVTLVPAAAAALPMLVKLGESHWPFLSWSWATSIAALPGIKM